MRTVVASVFVSLDNLMVGKNEDMSWVLDDFDAQGMGSDMSSLMANMDTILLGRTTYDIMTSHWPGVTEEGDPGAAKMNETPKVVFSRSLKTATWATTIMPEWPAPTLRRRSKSSRAGRAKDIVIFGSASIVQQLTELGLIDEYKTVVHPVILAEGKALFSDLKRRHRLELTESKSYANGVLLLNYREDAAMRSGRY